MTRTDHTHTLSETRVASNKARLRKPRGGDFVMANANQLQRWLVGSF